MCLRIFNFLFALCVSMALNSQKNVQSISNLQTGWVVTGKTYNNLDGTTTYTILDISGYVTGSLVTIIPLEHTIPAGWQVTGISGTNAENLKWTIQKTAGMKKGARITVCMDNRINSEWVIIERTRCGSCAMLQSTLDACYLIEKTSEGASSDSPQNSNNNNSYNPKPTVARAFKISGIDVTQKSTGGRATRGAPQEPGFVDFPSAKRIGAPLPTGYLNDQNSGNVSFYTTNNNYGVLIYIDSQYVGRIIHYFTEGAIGCRQMGQLNVRIKEGIYEYKAVYDYPPGYTGKKQSGWFGNIMISAKECVLINATEWH